MAENVVQEAMAGWPPWPRPRPSARPLEPDPYTPQKNSLGELTGFGALHGLDSETGSPLGLNIGIGAFRQLSTGTGAPSWARLGS